ncbi:MAG: hypothetical protein M1834_008021 [Cirrosporium novae-zelandiae]|nr:MAG: hypothetical protein M1834_008021 [Cirrosporium novae-zelandiae]
MDDKESMKAEKSHHEIPLDETQAKATLANDNSEEHNLTARQVIVAHPALVWWAFFFALSALGWGFDAQVNGAVISVSQFRKDFGYIYKGETVLPASWQSAFTLVSAVGQFFGGFLCGYIADRIGRRGALAAGVVFASGGIIGQMFSVTRVAFVISKLILGFGLGFYLTIGTLYCSEVSPVILRGLTTAGVNLGIVIGQLLSNAAIKIFGERTDRWAYRGPFVIQFLFVLFFLTGLPFAPESPWYLVRSKQIDAARHSLQRLYGKSTNVEDKLQAIQATVALDESLNESKWADCFRGTNVLRTNISMGVFICQHLVGIIFVLGYSTYFFELAGVDTSNSFNLGVGVTACGVLGNFLSWFIVNSSGRRKIFILGMIALTVLNFLIGILDVVPTDGAKWVQASCTVIYAFIYFMTIGAMAYVLLGEVSSPALRAKSASLATVVQSIFGIIMNVAVPYMVTPDEANMKGKVGFVFGGLGLLGTAWAIIYVPELKGRTFDEIDILFAQRVPPRKMGSYVLENNA